MSVYADTSFVLSWFIPDANHVAAIKWIGTNMKPIGIPWTPWNALEFNNAARGLCARGLISPSSLRALPSQVHQAFGAGDIVAAPLAAYRWWLESEALSHAHTVRLNVRTLDLLHVAAARLLRASEFLTFDQRQRTLAQAAGLRVVP